jgi:uncharacterized delta-60 repeat protein
MIAGMWQGAARVALALCLLGATRLWAADGGLDPSFGIGGVVLAPPIGALHASNGRAQAVIRQSDGKLVAAGVTSTMTSIEAGALVRVNVNGSRDTSFGSGGYVATATGSGNTSFEALLQQADGKLVVAGYLDSAVDADFIIARYDANGVLDPSFATGGIQRTSFGASFDRAYGIAQQSDGKLIVVGVTYNGVANTDLALARYNSDGSLDASFDGDGLRTINLGGTDSLAAVIVQSDGKIVAAGTKNSTNVYSVAVIRLLDDGAFDTTFSGDGLVTTTITGATDGARALLQQADGKLVVAGGGLLNRNGGQGKAFHVLRFNADGSSDSSFDGDGRVQTTIGSNFTTAAAVAQQPDGKLVVAGEENTTANRRFAVARYNSDGSLDPTFDADGKLSLALVGNESAAHGVTVQPDGRIVLTGEVRNTSLFEVAIARLNANGSLDTGFDSDGRTYVDLYQQSATLSALLRQADGKIVAVGSVDNGTFTDFVVMRFSADGVLDTSFDADGIAVTDLGTMDDTAYAVAQQADGNLLVVGDAWVRRGSNTSNDIAVVRYRTDGSVDFKLTTELTSGGEERGRAVVVQSDGKFVVAGSIGTGSDQDFALVRYTTSGTRDVTFDTDGAVVTATGASEELATAVLQQPDGRLVTSGYTRVVNDFGLGLARYATTGALDPSFDTDGVVYTGINRLQAWPTMLLRQPDGKLIVVGATGSGLGDIVAARYSVSGGLDPSFDGDGIATALFPTGADARGAVLQLDGKLLIAGRAFQSSPSRRLFLALRERPDGSPDTSFDDDGRVQFPVGISHADARALLSQPEGKAVLGGVAYDSAGNQVFALARIAASSCGDGIVGGSEQCDAGASNGAAGVCCDAACRFAPATTICRAASADCDVAESCSGVSDLCPPDTHPTCTATPSTTATPSQSATATDSPPPPSTATPIAAATASATETAAATDTPSSSPTATMPATATETVTASATPSATESPTLTETPTATESPTRTEAPNATESPTLTATPTPSATATRSATAVPSASASASVTPTPSPSPLAAGCSATPRPSCRGAASSVLLFKSGGGNRDRLVWKWRRGTIGADELGDPRVSSDYALCLYDARGSLASAMVPRGPGWSATRDGFRYRMTQVGLQRLDLRAGNGSASITLMGRGAPLPDPPLPASSPVVVQLVDAGGAACWQAVYDAAERTLKRNLATKLSGRTR